METPGPTIAIVDDDEIVRRALRRMIASLSYVPVEFGSGREFLAALPTTVFACALIDMHMPGLNGIDVIAGMRGSSGAPPAIIITGGDEPRMRERCLKAGAADFLLKPIEREAVLRAIRSATHVGEPEP
jgi:FixJ family two-component response regulator